MKKLPAHFMERELVTTPDDDRDGLLRALRETCADIETFDAAKPKGALAQHAMKAIFPKLYDLYPQDASLYKDDRARFVKMRNAAMAIAEQIDTRNAADKNRPPFHNRLHFLLVTVCGRVIDRVNQGFIARFGHETALPPQTPAALARHALTDLAHDFGHPGTTNKADGKYEPMLLEKQSWQDIAPCLREHNVDEKDQHLIHTAILASDPGLPKEIMRAAYDYHFCPTLETRLSMKDCMKKISASFAFHEQALFDLSGLVMGLYSGKDGKDAAFDAARLGDADLFASFGLSDLQSARECAKLDAEMTAHGSEPLLDGKGDPSPAKQLLALFKILGTRMTRELEPRLLAQFRTPGAHVLGSPHAQSLQRRAEERLSPDERAAVCKAAGLHCT